jgi:glycosyltransferase involved in cell wall biosynthesis
MNKELKTKILFMGDSLSGWSGLTFVISNIMLGFLREDKYEIAFATLSGKNSLRENFHIHGEEFNTLAKDIKIYDCQIVHKEGFDQYNQCIADFKPDIVFSNHDPWYLDGIALSPYRESYFWVHYATVEVPFYPDNIMFPTSAFPVNRKPMKQILQNADLIIPVTSVGTSTLKNMKLENVSDDHVYNGLDLDSVCNEENIDKSAVFGPHIKQDNFIFMTLGTNSERKKIDVVIEAFAKFIKKMDGSKKYRMYIHTDLENRIGGTDLATQVVTLGLKDHVFFPLSFSKNKLMVKSDLYKRYKASDCYIGLPSGEGFGYGYAEAMAHKKPVIYLDYGGPSDYLRNVGLPVKVKETFAAQNVYMKWAIADIDDAVRQMCRVVSDKNLKRTVGEACYQKSKEFDWSIIHEQLKYIILDKYKTFSKFELFDLGLKKIK